MRILITNYSTENNMALKEKAKKKREQRETPVPTLKSTISSDMLEQAKEKLRNEANTQATINAGTPTLPNVAGTTSGIQSVKPQTTGLTAPEIKNPVDEAAKERIGKTPSFSDMLANSMSVMRQNAEKEKTDAAKMQQYYALADVFNSIGKLSGSAVGGAIGGNAGESAPAVDPYKESRGYLAAFEKAKAANERLKALDDKAYALAATQEEREYNKRLRDADNQFKLQLTQEEREYNKKLRDADNQFKLQLTQLDHQWQKDFYDYKAKIEQAATEGNLKLKAELEAKQKAAEQAYWKERAEISQGYQVALKNMSADIVRTQMGLTGDGKSGKPVKTKAFTFHNNTKVDIPETLYPEMLNFFASLGEINGEYVDEENIEQVLRKHPKLVETFLKMHNGANVTEFTPIDFSMPYAVTYPTDRTSASSAGQSSNNSGAETVNPDKDFSEFKRK